MTPRSGALPVPGPPRLQAVRPVGRRFVPRRDGRRQGPDEWTDPHGLPAGPCVRLELVLRLDQALDPL